MSGPEVWIPHLENREMWGTPAPRFTRFLARPPAGRRMRVTSRFHRRSQDAGRHFLRHRSKDSFISLRWSVKLHSSVWWLLSSTEITT